MAQINYAGETALKELIAKLKAYADDAASNAASNIDLWTVVSELPTSNISTNKIYLLPATNTEDSNIYAEYIYANGSWEKLGEVKLDTDLSDYYTKSEVAAQISSSLSSYVTQTSLTTTLADYTKSSDFTEITAAEVDAMF